MQESAATPSEELRADFTYLSDTETIGANQKIVIGMSIVFENIFEILNFDDRFDELDHINILDLDCSNHLALPMLYKYFKARGISITYTAVTNSSAVYSDCSNAYKQYCDANILKLIFVKKITHEYLKLKLHSFDLVVYRNPPVFEDLQYCLDMIHNMIPMFLKQEGHALMTFYTKKQQYKLQFVINDEYSCARGDAYELDTSVLRIKQCDSDRVGLTPDQVGCISQFTMSYVIYCAINQYQKADTRAVKLTTMAEEYSEIFDYVSAYHCYKYIVNSRGVHPKRLKRAILNLADTLMKISRFKEAMFYYKCLLKIEPNNRAGLFGLALSYNKQHVFMAAYIICKDLLNIQPGHRLGRDLFQQLQLKYDAIQAIEGEIGGQLPNSTGLKSGH